MRAALVFALAIVLAPASALAHPHIWISQEVRVVEQGGQYTAVELEWRFDPMTSEMEISTIDEDQDGKISPEEIDALVRDTLPALQEAGFMTWLNTGGADFRPVKVPTFAARIDDPARFKPPEWNRSAGDKAGMPMPPNKQVDPTAPNREVPRNLVYVMRFELAHPTKVMSITTYDPSDFVRFEVDKSTLPTGCTLSKHPSYKAEFIPGYPVRADLVTCRLP